MANGEQNPNQDPNSDEKARRLAQEIYERTGKPYDGTTTPLDPYREKVIEILQKLDEEEKNRQNSGNKGQ